MPNSVTLEIFVETKKATGAIENFSNKATKHIEGIQNTFSVLKTIAVAAVGYLATRKVINFFAESIQAASEAEDAMNEFSTAVRLSGKAIDIKAFADFASGLQRVTKYSDDLIIKNAALLQNLGQLDQEGLQRATKAAMDLAAALSIDLTTATELVGKASQGQIGTFSRYGLVIKKGANSAETFSNVLSKIETQFSGAAAAQVNTYSGAVAQLSNMYSDTLEEIGNLIIKNPIVIEGIKLLSSVLGDLNDYLRKNNQSMNELISDGIFGLIKTIPILARSFSFLITVLDTTVDYIAKTLVAVEQGIDKLTTPLSSFKKEMSKIVNGFIQFYYGAKSDLLETQQEIVQQTEIDTQDLGESYDVWADDATSSMGEFAIKLEEFALYSEKKIEDFEKVVSKAAKNVSKFKNEVNKSFADLKIKDFGKIFADIKIPSFGNITTSIQTGFKGGIELLKEGWTNVSNLTVRNLWEGFKSGSVFIYNALSSAWQGLKTGLQFFGDILAGQPFTVLANAIKDIGTLPEQFLSAIENFDTILDGLLESLPTAISTLLEKAPEIFEEIIKKLPEVIALIIKAIPRIVDMFVKYAPRLAEALLNGLKGLAKVLADSVGPLTKVIMQMLINLVKNLSPILKELIRGLLEGLKAIMQELPALIISIFQELPTWIQLIIRGIIDGIIIIAKNLAPIIMALAEGICQAIPEIIAALIDEFVIQGGAETIAIELVKAVPKIAVALVSGVMRGLYEGFDTLGTTLWRAFMKSIDELTGRLKIKKPDWFNRLKIKTPEWFDKLKIETPEWLKDLKNVGGGGGGGGKGPITGIKGSFFQAGGIIPKGYPNDTFPASLTSGELVVPTSTTDNLFSLINALSETMKASATRQTQKDQNIVINLTVGEKQLAEVLFNLNRQGFRTA